MVTAKKEVLVIGGGLGGISAAISLAQEGFEVSLYEKNSHLGGKLNRANQDGFGFDLGPSILTMTHIFETLFEKSGKKMEDYVSIERLDLEWRSFFPDGTQLDLYGDLEKMEKENPALTAKDMDDYREFLAYAGKLYDITIDGYFSKGLDDIKEVFQHYGILNAMTGFDYFSSMYDGIEKRIDNPHFKEMLAYFIKYVGSSPHDAPAVLNMMIYMQHMQGVWYVTGGMHHLAEGLVKLGTELGVHFFTDQEIVELLTDNKETIVGAQLKDGRVLTADYYVSNMEVIPAYDRLLHEDRAKLDQLEKKFQPASSGMVIHLGVNKEYPQLGHHNFFFSENPDHHYDQVFHKHELPDDPTIYLVNVNKTDPTQALPGHENIKILPHIPYIPDEPFTEEEYGALRERVLDKLERMGLTDLRKYTVTENTWFPKDIEEAYYSNRGAIYGTLSDRKKNKGFKHPKKSEVYDNLFFVGGTVNPGGGMPMVTLSGQQTAQKIKEQEEKR